MDFLDAVQSANGEVRIMLWEGTLFLIEVLACFGVVYTASMIKFQMPEVKSKLKILNIEGKEYKCEPVEFKAA